MSVISGEHDIFNDDRSEVNQNPDNDIDKKETNIINVKQNQEQIQP
jgi:hypothetical protein